MGAKPASARGCHCGNVAGYSECCGRWHAGEPAPDAEALMRSRYSAYVLGMAGYLLDTWHPRTRPLSLDLEAPGARAWLGLSILARSQVDACHAAVEFVARSRPGGGRAQRLHERSRFVREFGSWLYIDGDVLE